MDELDALPVVVGRSGGDDGVGQPVVSRRRLSSRPGAEASQHPRVGVVEGVDLLRIFNSKQVGLSLRTLLFMLII